LLERTIRGVKQARGFDRGFVCLAIDPTEIALNYAAVLAI
jgi:hypothetical protein